MLRVSLHKSEEMLKNLKSEKEYYFKQLELARKEIDSLRRSHNEMPTHQKIQQSISDIPYSYRQQNDECMTYSAERPRPSTRSQAQAMTPAGRGTSCNRSASPAPHTS